MDDETLKPPYNKDWAENKVVKKLLLTIDLFFVIFLAYLIIL
jgi:hypothetical protein